MPNSAHNRLTAEGTYDQPQEFQPANKNKAPLRLVTNSVKGRATQSEQFNQQYARQGLQPSVGGVRSVVVEKEQPVYDPNKRRGGIAARAASTLGEGLQAQGDIMQETGRSSRERGIRSVAAEQYQNAGQRIYRTGKSLHRAGKRVLGRKKLTAAGVTSRWVGRGVTLSIWAWGFWVWLWFQLPFAVLSVVFMGITEWLHQFTLSLTPDSKTGKYIVEKLGTFFDTILDAVNAVMKAALGFDLDMLNPANFFMMTHLLVLFLSWGTLLAIGLIYTIAGQRAFTGKGAAGKNAMFLLALIGYTIPILNLFPWFFLWTLLVLKNPR